MSSPEELIAALEWSAGVALAIGFTSRGKLLRKHARELDAQRRIAAGEPAPSKAPSPVPTPSPFTKADCDTLYQTWVAAFGACNYPQFRKAFTPLYEQERGALHPLEQLVLAIRWAGSILKEHPRELGFMSPDRFASKIAFWLEVLDWPAEERFTRFADAMRGRLNGGR